MPAITTDQKRKIINDFAKVIQEQKTLGSKPGKEVINFRNEKIESLERPVVRVPLGLLRYRAENGRIASDVLNHIQSVGPLNECDTEAQIVLRGFLEAKDPEKTEILTKSIEHSGQGEPAIITCDGFLINGNRRKMVLEKLNKLHPGREEFQSMKVVILPGEGDIGGPPSLLEIEKLENRYQLQSEGKSEYFGFDSALSIKRKLERGFSIEEQLRDDPRYVKADAKEIAKAVKKCKSDYLLPLDCIDRYLQLFNREGLYGTVSSRASDREGRWQAFLEYSKHYHNYFKDPSWIIEHSIEDSDIGSLEDAAFKIIRLRSLSGLPKLYTIMRGLPKLCAHSHSRKELLKLSDEVQGSISANEAIDEHGNPLSIEENDAKWVSNNQKAIIYHVRKALDFHESHVNKETPIMLLEAALNKLNHDNMKVESIAVVDLDKARKLASDIQKSAKDIESEIYQKKKGFEES